MQPIENRVILKPRRLTWGILPKYYVDESHNNYENNIILKNNNYHKYLPPTREQWGSRTKYFHKKKKNKSKTDINRQNIFEKTFFTTHLPFPGVMDMPKEEYNPYYTKIKPQNAELLFEHLNMGQRHFFAWDPFFVTKNVAHRPIRGDHKYYLHFDGTRKTLKKDYIFF